MSQTPSPLNASKLVGLLAEPGRRRVIAALILGASDRTDIATQTGLELREVVHALDRLTTVGLVEPLGENDGDGYILLAQAFELAARAEAPAKAETEFPDEVDEHRRVLDRAFKDGRLLWMPSKRSHRLVVLDHLAQRFEPGERYTERQVNAMLASADPDTATLRRYLVDEAMLDRADGEYWRIGASYTIS